MNINSHFSFKPNFFYGWILVAVLLLLVSLGMGTSVYMYSLVAGAVSEEFAASRMVVMAGSMGMIMMMGLLSPLVGKLLDQYPSQLILIPGALVMGVGFVLVALSANIWMVVASYVLFISVGTATLSLLAAATILSRWFVRHRGLAVGIAALGTQFGGFFYPPLFAATMEAYDWRIAVGGVGVLIMVLAPLLIWVFVVDHPSKINQKPLGSEFSEASQNDNDNDNDRENQQPFRLPFVQLLGHRNFLLVVLIAGANMVTNAVLLANLSLFATDLGETAVRGAFLVSFVALLGVFSSPLLGWLSDVVSVKRVVAILTLSQAISCLVFSVSDNYVTLLPAAFFMGIAGGGVFPVFASLVGHLFDDRVYGQVMGTATLWMSLLASFAMLFAGWAHDVTNSYRLLFLGLLVMLVVVLVCIALVRLPRKPSEKFGAVLD